MRLIEKCHMIHCSNYVQIVVDKFLSDPSVSITKQKREQSPNR